MAQDGWLKRQAERLQKEAGERPSWKKRVAAMDDARRQRIEASSQPTPRMRKGE